MSLSRRETLGRPFLFFLRLLLPLLFLLHVDQSHAVNSYGFQRPPLSASTVDCFSADADEGIVSSVVTIHPNYISRVYQPRSRRRCSRRRLW